MATSIKRYIPSRYNKALLFPDLNQLKQKKEEINGDDYEKTVISFEKKCESNLINILKTVEITATVKTDRYSLPYQNEMIVVHECTKLINYNFSIFYPAREILKKLLVDHIYKLRFYLLVDVVLDETYPIDIPIGSVVFKFRYRIHY